MNEPEGLDEKGAESAGISAMGYLAAASFAIAGASHREELINAVRKSVEYSGADRFYLARLCEGGAEVEVLAAWEKTETIPNRAGVRYLRTAFLVLQHLRPDTPLISDDFASDPRFDEDAKKLLLAQGVRSTGVYPLIRGGELSGFLTVSYRTPHAHTTEDRHFFSVIAQLASAALAGIETREELARQVKRANAMHRAAETVSALDDEGSMWAVAAQLLVSEIGFADSWIATLDEEAGELRERAQRGAGEYPGRAPIIFPLNDERIASVQVVRSGKPLVDLDLPTRAEREGWGEIARRGKLRTLIIVPLRAGGTPIGALAVARTEESVTEDDITMLSTFASQLATAVFRARAERERRRQVEALEEAYENQALLLATVRELSTPVIPVLGGVLVVPLVGTLDTTRSAQVMEALLDAIQREKAEVVIIDVTGVPTVDTGVANHLLRTTRAAALLGAQCVLVGMSPVVAQTVVQLGVDLAGLETRSNLQAGISYALSRRGLEIRPAGQRR